MSEEKEKAFGLGFLVGGVFMAVITMITMDDDDLNVICSPSEVMAEYFTDDKTITVYCNPKD